MTITMLCLCYTYLCTGMSIGSHVQTSIFNKWSYLKHWGRVPFGTPLKLENAAVGGGYKISIIAFRFQKIASSKHIFTQVRESPRRKHFGISEISTLDKIHAVGLVTAMQRGSASAWRRAGYIRRRACHTPP